VASRFATANRTRDLFSTADHLMSLNLPPIVSAGLRQQSDTE
jgi:hypothetical protein